MRRILAIDPTSRGFGFVCFERSGPIDWGTVYVSGRKTSAVLQHITERIERLRPTTVLIEDYKDAGCRRCDRIKRLLADVELKLTNCGIRVNRVTSRVVRAYFSDAHATTKAKRAAFLASQFPELAPRLPPIRKPWMSEDDRMSIFDAAALAVTYLSKQRVA